jgi:hypothetical protein
MRANRPDTFCAENVNDDEALLGVLSSRALQGRRGIGHSIYVTDKRIIAAYRGKLYLVYPFVLFPLYVITFLQLIIYGFGYLPGGREHATKMLTPLKEIDNKDFEVFKLEVERINITKPSGLHPGVLLVKTKSSEHEFKIKILPVVFTRSQFARLAMLLEQFCNGPKVRVSVETTILEPYQQGTKAAS